MPLLIRIHARVARKALCVMALLSFTSACLYAAPASAKDFECAWRPVDADTGGVHDVKSLLPLGDPLDNPAQLMAVVDTLRKQGLAEILIIDNLIGQYCPIVAADTSLNDDQKTLRVRQFATQITSLVFSAEDAQEIVLDVPFPPDVVDQIEAKARAAGVSPEIWIAETVSAAIGKNP
ncbi:hypothetical protein [Mesorhizobium sp. KR9-304]|uniref:hypothetical protein n=1 Tax=Mesorhizobium sp. KR9-304 TaxID=3156614 RepID=UPI0032B4CEBE